MQAQNSKNVSFSDIDVENGMCNIRRMGILTEARKAAGLTQEELAEKVGATRITIVRLEKKDSISRKWAEKLSPILDVPIANFLLGTSADSNQVVISPNSPLKPTELTIANLPVVGKVAAGYWRSCDYQDDIDQFPLMPSIMNSHYPAESQFIIVVEGESLNQTAPNGSFLHCAKLLEAGIDPNNLEDGQLVIVQRTRQQFGEFEMTAKRIRKNGDWELWPESDRPEFQEPFRIADFQGESDETIEIIAIVVAIIKKP
jgi:DNA-binding XRE family transcriptional regulator